MEKKNLILALALSILVITVYQLVFMPKKPLVNQKTAVKAEVKPQPKKQESVPSKSQSALEQLQKQKEAPKPAVEQIKIENHSTDKEKNYTIETDVYTAVLSNKGAALKSFILKNFLDDGEPDKHNLELIPTDAQKIGLYPFHLYDEANLEFFREANLALFDSKAQLITRIGNDNKKSISFIYSDSAKGIYIEKTYTFYGNSHVIDFDYRVLKNNAPVKASFVFGPKLGENLKLTGTSILNNYEIGSFNGEDSNFNKLNKYHKTVKNLQTFIPNPQEKFKFSPLQPIQSGRNNYWVSFNQNYFTALVKTDYTQSSTDIFFVNEYLEPGKTKLYCYLTITKPLSIYLGPKDVTTLQTAGERHSIIKPDEVINLGWFGFISKLLRSGVNFIYSFIPNYGWAIVFFTIFLKIILFPLTYTSGKSMAKMQTLQPKIKAIKKKYKNQKDPEQRKQMNVETMELYKKEKINPASGCFPLLLQMPILFGFFTLLRSTIEVRHEPWILWIKDLSLKDPLYILPIAMGVTQIIVQKLSPTSGDSNQKKMAYIMPIFFVFICMNLPSGLTLYWFISNLLQIFQQKITNNLKFKKKKTEHTN
jgi:YidC/Oxa1 family membrane protein insertase